MSSQLHITLVTIGLALMSSAHVTPAKTQWHRERKDSSALRVVFSLQQRYFDQKQNRKSKVFSSNQHIGKITKN
jgi:hypothetical protein